MAQTDPVFNASLHNIISLDAIFTRDEAEITKLANVCFLFLFNYLYYIYSLFEDCTV